MPARGSCQPWAQGAGGKARLGSLFGTTGMLWETGLFACVTANGSAGL